MDMIPQVGQDTEKSDPPTPKLKPLVNQLMIKLMQLFKTNVTQHSTIQRFQRRMVNQNQYCVILHLMTFYRNFFKIYISLNMNFQASLCINLKFGIVSSDPKIMQKFPQMKQTIESLKFLEKSNKDVITCKFCSTNGIKIQQKSFYCNFVNVNSYAQEIIKKLRLPYSVCDALIDQLQKNTLIEYTCNQMVGQEQKIKNTLENALTTYEMLGLIEKQNQRFRQFYCQEGTSKGFLINPASIPLKTNQVLRSIYFYKNPNRQIKQMTPQENPRFQGTFSNIHHIIDCGIKIQTIFSNREGAQHEEMHPNFHERRNQGIIELICKSVGGIQKYKDAAISSFKNQVQYLKLKAGLICPFICNYYFEVRQPSNVSNLSRKQTEDKIYSDFHPIGVWDKFYSNNNKTFTMSDIINLAEQLMIGIIQFYLEEGYLNRDIKQLNLLINHQGVIQIIDHGSVYPFSSFQRSKKMQDKIDRQKKKFDPSIRSTLYVKKAMFENNPKLLEDYKSWSRYKDYSGTHRTFDVYSVGTILSEIVGSYEMFSGPKWMEVSMRWQSLIEMMMQVDPRKRIQMQDALAHIRQLRAFIFQKNKQTQ